MRLEIDNRIFYPHDLLMLLAIALVLWAGTLIACGKSEHITKIVNPPEPRCQDLSGQGPDLFLSQVEDKNSICFEDELCFYGCRHHGPHDRPKDD